MAVELAIQNGSKIFYLPVEDGMKWETERKGSPGKLTFKVPYDKSANFQEGNAVSLKKDGKKVFFGFIFTKKRDKDRMISVTAYDQLRYFKNKDTYVYKNKRADQVVRMLAKDFRLNVGSLANTGYVIPSRVEDNKTLFDIVQTALDLTLTNRGKLYVLYDNFGKLTLKDVESMKLNLLIDESTGENFEYSSSIDSDTYNKVKLVYENKDSGKREVYIAQSSKNMNEWGVLQYFEKINTNVGAKAKANALLKMYNQKARTLSIKNAAGDVRVRAGTSLIIKMNLGDVNIYNYMLVEKASHAFSNNEHTMDLTLVGGGFIA